MTTYHGTLTGAVAHEHTDDLLRAARLSRLATVLPDDRGHRTPRRRVGWWTRTTARLAGT